MAAMTANNDLSGTVALVTGASSGIGEATASRLAQLGSAVAILARRADRLQQLAERIQGEGGRALVIEADVSSEEQARGAVEQAVTELGRLDTLVNNAGVMLLGPIEDAPLEEWQRMLEVNVAGLLYCAHAALPHAEPHQVPHGDSERDRTLGAWRFGHRLRRERA